ncbi:hypothetical protein ABBQ38_011006 [Trebouxia sp. C0009 RCD-2024]
MVLITSQTCGPYGGHRAEVCHPHQKPYRENLLFVRFYASEDEPTAICDPRQDLGLRHLVWGRVECKARGRKTRWQPHYAVVEAQAAVQQVCICPHFAFWKQGNRNHFLVNDLLDLWPPTDLIPATVPSPEDRQQAKHGRGRCHECVTSALTSSRMRLSVDQDAT